MSSKLKTKMIPGYKFICRESPKHEPQIVGTRLTVSRIVRDLEYGNNVKRIGVSAYPPVNRPGGITALKI